ncbi:MAG TPA: 1,4-dihydroxy-6-naphthoate synthase [Spirochaetota bacterium]|nr:1,4-dihydroxy-6-naphthoate synthase [Spirochaetota bacterium]HQP49092.1 1,4-dihydroxy-6-naphthoate synthase [Spirochaetota bacterium]
MDAMTLAFSPCPNDTFIFHAMLHGLVDTEGLSFNPYIHDVEDLNRNACEGRFHITKLSIHAYLLLQNNYCMLDAGAALGFGCGPVLVAREDSVFNQKRDSLKDAVIAIPGEYTTAHLLLKLWFPGLHTVSTRFNAIMPGVRDGVYDAGLIIHEGRFVYPRYGLRKIVDLGEWWEQETGMPIPLGCIAIRRDLMEHHERVGRIISESAAFAQRNPGQSRSYICSHAQEMDDAVIREHIALYVNDFSLSLGEEGMKAVIILEEMARCRGILP